MKKILILVLLFAGSFTFLFAQKSKPFDCPLKKGKIVIEIRSSESDENPGATFESKSHVVYSCSPGLVNAIDTVNGLITVYIESDNYSFSYHSLESVNIIEGELIKKGKMIGRLKEGERLFLITSKDKSPIEPANIINCKVVKKYIE